MKATFCYLVQIYILAVSVFLIGCMSDSRMAAISKKLEESNPATEVQPTQPSDPEASPVLVTPSISIGGITPGIEVSAPAVIVADSTNGSAPSSNTEDSSSVVSVIVEEVIHENIQGSVSEPSLEVVAPVETIEQIVENEKPISVPVVEVAETVAVDPVVDVAPVRAPAVSEHVVSVESPVSVTPEEQATPVVGEPVVTPPVASAPIVTAPAFEIPPAVVAIAEKVADANQDSNEEVEVVPDASSGSDVSFEDEDDKKDKNESYVKLSGKCSKMKKVGFIWHHEKNSKKKKTAVASCQLDKFHVRIKVKSKELKSIKVQTVFYN